MTEEPEDYEGPWPEGDAMTEWVMVPREPTEQMLVALANTPCRVGWPAKAYRAMLDAAPAAPQQAEPVGYFQRDCDYFEQVEDVYQWDADVIPLYLHPPAEPQQAEPVSYAVFDPSGEVVYAALSETRCIEYRDNEYRYGHSAAKHWAVRPVFAHPPAAEVQRLREAAMAVVDAYRNIGPVTVAIEDLSRAL